MPQVNKNEEQRKHWNKYNNSYSKEHYKAIGLRLHMVNDKDIIEILEKKKKEVNVSDYIKSLIRKDAAK